MMMNDKIADLEQKVSDANTTLWQKFPSEDQRQKVSLCVRAFETSVCIFGCWFLFESKYAPLSQCQMTMCAGQACFSYAPIT